MSIHRSRAAGMALPFVLVGAIAACSGTGSQARTPTSTAATQPPPRSQAAPRGPAAPVPSNSAAANSPKALERSSKENSGESDADDAELVVGRDVVARCPTLRLVRQHVGEFDPDTVWLAVLESIADCMSQGGAMAQQAIGVSGDEEHRHVVREVLGTRGVAPTRVIAKHAQGAAECQGDTDCSKRIEITIVAP